MTKAKAPAAKKSAAKKSAATKTPATKRKAKPEDRGMSKLERILLLVPYVVRNQGVSVDELADKFGATREEILDDLQLVFMCGLPDYTPADLIDVSWEGDRVSIRMADYFAKPLRLTRSEAIPLYVRAQSLLDLFQERDTIGELAPLRSALAKLARALLPQDGGVGELAERIKIHLEAGEARWLPVLRDAVTTRTRVQIEYFTYSRDALTQRRIDPYIVFASLGHWYAAGYCHLAQDRRIFRLDRIKSAEAIDEHFEPPEDAVADVPPALVYEPSPEDALVTLRASPRASTWLVEYHPVESVKDLPKGWKELELRTSAFPWLEKLLLRFGPQVKVVSPPELQERLRAAADRILGLYKPKRKS